MTTQNQSSTSISQRETHFPSSLEGASMNPRRDLINYVRDYARENPEIAALWCVGIGFILGWKLKPW